MLESFVVGMNKNEKVSVYSVYAFNAMSLFVCVCMCVCVCVYVCVCVCVLHSIQKKIAHEVLGLLQSTGHHFNADGSESWQKIYGMFILREKRIDYCTLAITYLDKSHHATSLFPLDMFNACSLFVEHQILTHDSL